MKYPTIDPWIYNSKKDGTVEQCRSFIEFAIDYAEDEYEILFWTNRLNVLKMLKDIIITIPVNIIREIRYGF